MRLGETVFTRTHYIAISSKYSFLFSATHLAVTNTFIDSKILRMAYIVNLTQKILVLTKNIRLRIIYKQVETVHFVCNIANILKALAFAVATDVISFLPTSVTPAI